MKKLGIGLIVGFAMFGVLVIPPAAVFAAAGEEEFKEADGEGNPSPLEPYKKVNRGTFIGSRGHAQDKFGALALTSTRAPLPRPGMKHQIGTTNVWISPDVILTGVYSDNVFKEHRDTATAFVFSVSPSLTVSRPVGQRGRLAAIYVAEVSRADQHSDELDHEVHYVSFDANLGLGAPRKLGLNLTHDIGQHVTAPNMRDDRVKRYWTNTTTLIAKADVGKSDVEFKYQHEAVDFADRHNRFDDMDSDSFQLTLAHPVGAKTAAFVRYRHQIVDNYGDASDNYLNWYGVGLKMEPSARVSGSVEVGYTERKFARRGNGERKNKGVATAGLLSYRATKKLTFMARIFRQINDTTNAQNNEGNGRSYKSSGVSLRTTYALTKELSPFVGGGYIKDQYDGRDPDVGADPNAGYGRRRRDDICSAEAGVQFRPRKVPNMVVGAMYEYGQNTSNVHKNSYRENKWTLSVAYVF